MSTVELTGASRWYGTVLGLSGVELRLDAGVTALLGPNGAGKSTLIRLVTGQLRPSAGTVRVFEEDPFANPRVAARWGVVPEEDGLPLGATGSRWVEYLLRLHGYSKTQARLHTEKVLAELQLEAVAGRPIATYSRGMRQRLKLAQAMAHDPELFVLDEPLAGLDPVGRKAMIERIRRWGRGGRSVLVSSHILHEVELMTQEIVLMYQGRVLASGNVHEIRELLDEHPHRIRLTTPAPKRLAARLLDLPGIRSVAFSEQHGSVELETTEPGAFYDLVAELVVEDGLNVTSMSPRDDNLEAVFNYLVHP